MILVTGGTGLVGSHLLYHLLLENDTVKATYQKTSDLHAVKKIFSYYTSRFENLFDQIVWVEAELCDVPSLKVAFEEITHVYHCAALVSFDPADYLKMRRINIEGTSNIVNFCISKKVVKLCFVSSIATLGKNSKGNPEIDESVNWNNSADKSDYAITKYGAEMEIWRASQEGVPVIIVNPGVILGSGFWEKGSGKLFSKVYSGLKYYTEGTTGFVDVKDVVQIMVGLMKSNIKNERFILVAKNSSYKEILFQIADSFHKKRPPIKISALGGDIFWRIDWLRSKVTGKKPLLTKYSAKSSQSKNYYTSKKIRTALSFEFESIDKTIENICKDFLH